MRRYRSLGRLGLWVVLMSGLGGLTARAQDVPAGQDAPAAGDDQETRARAKALFEAGVASYDAGRYEEALASFQEAFRVRPHPLVRVNIANCYDKLGKPLEALFHFEQFATADVGSPEQRKEVNAAVERLRKQIGQVVVRVTPDGAMVTIDGGEQRRTPLVDPLSLTAGKHDFEVKLEGYQTVQRSLTVQGGSTSELSVVLSRAGDTGVSPALAAATPAPGEQPQVATPPAAEPAPEPAPVPALEPSELVPQEPKAETDSGGLPMHVWIIGGASIALLLAGSITGLMALDAESEFDRALRTRHDPLADPITKEAAYLEALDASDNADALALTTDILLIGALAGAGVTVVLALNSRKSGDGEEEKPSATLTPVVGPQRAGLSLSGAF